MAAVRQNLVMVILVPEKAATPVMAVVSVRVMATMKAVATAMATVKDAATAAVLIIPEPVKAASAIRTLPGHTASSEIPEMVCLETPALEIPAACLDTLALEIPAACLVLTMDCSAIEPEVVIPAVRVYTVEKERMDRAPMAWPT